MVKRLCYGFKNVAINFLIIQTVLTIGQIYLYGAVGMIGFNMPFIWYLELPYLILYILAVEVYFFFTHYTFHSKKLYPIHKQHHYFIHPVALAGSYAEPIEYMLVNNCSIFIGPLLFPSHVITYLIFLYLAILSNILSHSGWDFYPKLRIFSPKFHDTHHLKFNCNYSVFGLMDYLCGTLE